MTYTYDNPGLWKEGTPVTIGDIFKVTGTEASDNSSYTAGDFYIARFTGKIDQSKPYPVHGTSDSNWGWINAETCWSQTGDISLHLNGSGDTSLYGNGLNMLEVRVYMTPKNPNNKNITVSPEELQAAVTLVDYATGVEFKPWKTPPKAGDEKNMAPGGYFCTTAGEFLSPSGVSVSNNEVGKQYTTLYFTYKNDIASSLKMRLGCIITPTGEASTETVDTINSPGTENSSSNYVNILPKKNFIFGEGGDVNAKCYSEESVSGFIAMKYYVHFTDNSEVKHVKLLKKAITSYPCQPITEDCFHIKSTTGYIACCFFTDDTVKQTDARMDVGNIGGVPYYGCAGICSNFPHYTFRYHEEYGVCVVLVRSWVAGIRDYKEASSAQDDFWGGGMSFYDIYGNECRLSCDYYEPSSGDVSMNFTVLR